jgi:peptidoglycan/xylan/chitin deacetylase (PgdA/CDA1 family)
METVTIRPSLSAKEKVKRGIKNAGLHLLQQTGAASLIGRTYGGRGVVLMYHEFTREPDELLGQGCRIEDFEWALAALRRQGRDFVTLSEAMRRLEQPDSSPFVALTFDDGYRSNMDLALPVMEKFNAPATIFVPTDMINRSIFAWWLGLRELALKNDRVDVEPMSTRFECDGLDAKKVALARMTAWIWQDFSRVDALAPVFDAYKVSLPDVVEQLIFTEDDMIAADRHPLIEIGAHTTTHRALTLLPEEALRRDIGDNKTWLENKLQRQVPHFAYPYGPPSIGGRREAEIVESLGFETAWTTEAGCLFPDSRRDRFLMPRQNAENTDNGRAQVACGVQGVFRAIGSRGGSPLIDAGAAA